MPRIFKGDETLIKLWIPLKEKGTISSLKIVLFTNEPETAPVFNFTDVDLDGLNVFSLRVNEYTFAEMSDGILNYIASGVINGETFYFERQSNYYIKTPTNYVPTEPCKLISYRHEVDGNFFKLDAAEKGVDGFYEVNISAYDFGHDKYMEGYNKAYDLGLADGDLTWINDRGGEGTLEKPYSVSRAIDVEGFNGKGTTSENKIYIIGKLVRLQGGGEDVDDYNYEWVLAGSTKLASIDSISEWAEDAIILDDTFYGHPNYETLLVSGNVYTSINGDVNILRNVEVIEIDPARYFNTKLVDTVDSVNYYKRAPALGFDGFIEVTLDATPFGEIKYNEGYDVGYDVGYDEGYDNAVNNKETVLPNGICLSGSTWETFDTTQYDWSKIRDMNNMFQSCTNLTSLDVSNWDTSKVTNMAHMFDDCTNLTSLDVSNWDTSKVTDMGYMFDNCTNLTSLDVSNWDTSNVTYMGGMFNDCDNLTSLDLSNWDTSKVTDINNIFYHTGLRYVYLQNWNLESLVSFPSYLLNLGRGVKELDMSNWNMPKITTLPNFLSCPFDLAQNEGKMNVTGWKFPKLTTLKKLFCDCYGNEIKGLETWDVSNITDFSSLFDSCWVKGEIDLSSWDTSKVTDMSNMFDNAQSITSLGDISSWDTSKVTNMSYMFNACLGLLNWDFLKNWDTSNVTDMSYMFSICRNITSLDLSNWDTSKVTKMSSMFSNCGNLTELKMGGDVSNVTNVSGMFGDITTTGTFYYNPQYDYSNIIAQLPSTWTAVPME